MYSKQSGQRGGCKHSAGDVCNRFEYNQARRVTCVTFARIQMQRNHNNNNEKKHSHRVRRPPLKRIDNGEQFARCGVVLEHTSIERQTQRAGGGRATNAKDLHARGKNEQIDTNTRRGSSMCVVRANHLYTSLLSCMFMHVCVCVCVLCVVSYLLVCQFVIVFICAQPSHGRCVVRRPQTTTPQSHSIECGERSPENPPKRAVTTLCHQSPPAPQHDDNDDG